ncbi:NADH-quinone oxidoreductase subunit A [Methylomagnum ishizawai]|uniref:NADH-quinone oxidoreductase subunit A n=1 Tax=Methylomagnum ishizawai TaxID=1760988 RepID=A0A1Y6CW38_9GAMM|nr:NADH-quinone oxidoreductase subunit A [Methylomagnum ishizawai]SMF94879.1 NADH-quinone oxidoreductase subunit A [Methylomagnum ishizawai]
MDDFVQVSQLWPLIAYSAAALAVVAAMLALPRFLSGQRPPGRYTGSPFESGVVPVGDIHVRLAVQYYPVALFFVIFDLEAIFIYAWAVAFREAGWPGYVEMLTFILVLLAALFYLCRSGALDWRTRRQRSQDAYFKH